MWITGPIGRYRAVFVLDTGSPVTIVAPDVLDLAGYGPGMGTVTSRLEGVGGSRPGYRLVVSRLEVQIVRSKASVR